MIAILLAVAMAVQGPGRLQPGTGIVSGTLKTTDGKAAAGVRVGAVDVDDPSASSLISVAETDSAGRYRLTNVPAGDYYIVAGRFSDLRYYPSGTDRSAATKIRVEAASVRPDINFTVPQFSQRPPASTTPRSSADEVAFQLLAAETNVERKTQLMSQFEKTFPQSARLGEAYLSLMSAYARRNDGIRTVGYGDKAVQTNSSNVRTLLEVSRTYASLQAQTSQMDKALAYAEKAVTLSKGLKVQGPPRGMRPAEWQQWTASMEASAQKNLAWVQQVASWHQRSLFSLMAPTRR